MLNKPQISTSALKNSHSYLIYSVTVCQQVRSERKQPKNSQQLIAAFSKNCCEIMLLHEIPLQSLVFRFFVFVKLVDFLVILTVSYISFHVIDSSFNFVVFLGMTAIPWFGSRLTRSVYTGTLTSACFCFLSLLCHLSVVLLCLPPCQFILVYYFSFIFYIFFPLPFVKTFVNYYVCVWIHFLVCGLFPLCFFSFLETA